MGRKKLVRKSEPPAKRGIPWPRWTGFHGMTLRSWLELLVVPLALVVISFLFTAQQDQRQQRTETQRAEAEQELAGQRAQDEALQAYLSQMGSLLKEKDLRESKEDSKVRTLARARTLTVLGRLDPSRKTAAMQYLVEAELVQRAEGRGPIIPLTGANLSGAYLPNADLVDANLSGAYLPNADLVDANLSGAYLSSANVSAAYLNEANLSAAILFDANLRGAVLDDANLSDAKGITNEQLSAAWSLVGATMRDGQTLKSAANPDGPTFEEWLKSKDQGEKKKSAGSS